MTDPRIYAAARAKSLQDHRAAVEKRADELHKELLKLREDRAPLEQLEAIEKLRMTERVLAVQLAHSAREFEEQAK